MLHEISLEFHVHSSQNCHVFSILPIEHNCKRVHFGFFELTLKMFPYSTWNIIGQNKNTTTPQLFDSGQIFKNLEDTLNSDKRMLYHSVFDVLYQACFVGERH